MSLPLTGHYALAYTIGGVTTAKLLGAACLPIALFHVINKRRALEGLSQTGALLCVGYFSLAMLSYLIASSSSWDVLGAQSNVLSILLLLLVTVALVDSITKLRWTLLMTVGSLALASVYVIRDWQGNRAYVGYRPGGISVDANYFATAAAACLPLAFVLIRVCRSRWERIYLIGCFIVTVVAFFLAASRGGLIGGLAGLLIILTRSRKKLRSVVIAACLVVPLLALVPNSPLERLLNPGSGDRQAVEARQIAWRAGWRMFVDHPLAGIGLARFKTVVLQYEDATAPVQVESLAHNTYIEVAAEQGLPGFLLFIGTLGAAYITLQRAGQLAVKMKSQFLSQASIGLQAALVAAWVGAFFISAWWFRFYWFPVFLAFCMRPIALTMIRRRAAIHNVSVKMRKDGIRQLDWAYIDDNQHTN